MPRPVAPRPLRRLAAGFGCTFAGVTKAPSPGPAPAPPGAVPVAPSEEAVVGLRASIIAVAAARGASIGDRARRRVEACDDPATLQAWLLALVTGGDADAVIGG